MNKYHAKKVQFDGLWFSSIFERDRYIQLKELEKLGVISNLQTQVKYEVIPKQIGERSAHYIADFVYEHNGNIVVEDTKGYRTPDYILKRKLMLWVNGIKIQEVKKSGSKKHPKKHQKK